MLRIIFCFWPCLGLLRARRSWTPPTILRLGMPVSVIIPLTFRIPLLMKASRLTGGLRIPKRGWRFAPPRSASTTITFLPRSHRAIPRLAVTKLLPIPPLPPAMAQICFSFFTLSIVHYWPLLPHPFDQSAAVRALPPGNVIFRYVVAMAPDKHLLTMVARGVLPLS